MAAAVAADASHRTTAAFGMWVFLATEVLFFGVLFFGYLVMRLQHPDAFAAASRHTDVVLGTANTAVLLTSSLSVALAVIALERGRRTACEWLLATTVVLGLIFLALKGLEYANDAREGLLPWRALIAADLHSGGAHEFLLMYFVMTGAHALHLIVGVGTIAVMWALVARGTLSAQRTAPLEMGALYWHLIDIVWVFLYPLLYLVSRT